MCTKNKDWRRKEGSFSYDDNDKYAPKRKINFLEIILVILTLGLRLQELNLLVEKYSKEKNLSLVGQIVDVLVECENQE